MPTAEIAFSSAFTGPTINAAFVDCKRDVCCAEDSPAQRCVYMPHITYKDLISWGEGHNKRPADIARDLGMSTQALNSWRKRNQVAARQSDRVAAYMAEVDQKSGADLKSAIVRVYGKVTRDLRPAHYKLDRAIGKLLGTLTDEQATHITELIYKFAGENIANEDEPTETPSDAGEPAAETDYSIKNLPRRGVVEGRPELRHYAQKRTKP